MALIQDSMIGGATVARYFRRGADDMKPGMNMTRAELLALPRGNLQALVDTSKLVLYPPTPALLGELGQLHAVHLGFGKYDVIEGRRLNESELTKEEAEAMIAKLVATAAVDETPLPGEEVIAEEPAAPAPPN